MLVVGGGISGLTAAYRLLRHSNLSVRVLEANDRVGGRTVNLPLPGGKITEGGGQWTGPGQDRVQALARELGIKMFDTYVTGESVYVYQGNRQPHTGTLPPLGPAALADVVQNLTRLDQMANTVPLDAPWQAPNAEQWDATTFGQWLDANVATAEARSLYTLVFSIINGQDPHATSLLFALFVIHSGGGIARLIGTSGGAQNSRFVGGSQEISLRMARRLGSRVMLQAPVDHIDQTSRKHVLVRSGTQEFVARRVIVAMTPQDANRVRYAPTLTTQRIMLQKMWPIGGGWKTFAVYKKPFWRAQGLNGGAITDLPAALYTSDNSPPDGSLGVLLSFFGTANQKFEFGGSPRQLNDLRAPDAARCSTRSRRSSASRHYTRSSTSRRTGCGNPGSPAARPPCPLGCSRCTRRRCPIRSVGFIGRAPRRPRSTWARWTGRYAQASGRRAKSPRPSAETRPRSPLEMCNPGVR